MVFDRIANLSIYKGLGTLIDRAIDYVRTTDFADLPDQRVELDGDRLFAMIQSYATSPAETRKVEAHRKYIDLQYIVAGAESIFVAPTGDLKVTTPYDESKDVMFLADGTGMIELPAGAGSFALLWPQDAHKPCCIRGTAQQVKKVVVKILREVSP